MNRSIAARRESAQRRVFVQCIFLFLFIVFTDCMFGGMRQRDDVPREQMLTFSHEHVHTHVHAHVHAQRDDVPREQMTY